MKKATNKINKNQFHKNKISKNKFLLMSKIWLLKINLKVQFYQVRKKEKMQKIIITMKMIILKQFRLLSFHI